MHTVKPLLTILPFTMSLHLPVLLFALNTSFMYRSMKIKIILLMCPSIYREHLPSQRGTVNGGIMFIFLCHFAIFKDSLGDQWPSLYFPSVTHPLTTVSPHPSERNYPAQHSLIIRLDHWESVNNSIVLWRRTL